MKSRLRAWKLWSKKNKDKSMWWKLTVLIGINRSATFDVFMKRYYL